MASDVIDRLCYSLQQINEAKKKFGLSVRLQVVLSISVDEQVSNPTIGLEETDVEFFGAVGASIDIDTYRGG